ncbi:MAG: c-type cytochrome domain-containing protein, partial [Verrucomicrobiota bacterium]
MKKRYIVGGGVLVLAAAVAVVLRAAELPEKVRPFDLDKDGKLSADEFWDSALFAKMDTNKDGFVTPLELIVYYTKNPPPKTQPAKQGTAPAQPQRSPEESFQYLDRDADGSVSLQELEQLNDVVPMFRDNSGMARIIFNQLDMNRDRGLSLEEFREITNIGKVKSQAGSTATKQPHAGMSETLPAPKEKAVPLKPEEVAFFEKNIRPVLVDHCYKCHSAEAEKVKGGLALDTRAGLREGGDSGPSIVPGDLEKSLLIEAIRYKNDDLQMPPEKNGGKLSDSVIANFEQWVKMGAPDPRSEEATTARAASIEKGREYWAFKPVAKATPPTVKDAGWPRS